jgi:hypothetical protein
MINAIKDYDALTVSARPVTVPIMVIMGVSFGYTVVEAAVFPVTTAASVTTAAAAGEQLAEKGASSPTVQEIVQNISGGVSLEATTVNITGNVVGGNAITNINVVVNIILTEGATNASPEQLQQIENAAMNGVSNALK